MADPSTSQPSAETQEEGWRPIAKAPRVDGSDGVADSATPASSSSAGRLHSRSFQRDPTKFHVLLGVTGSVAAIKVKKLVTELTRQSPDNRLQLRIVTTENGARFFLAEDFAFPVYRDADEWAAWKGRGDPVLHIELRKWADLFLIAPLDANTMAKMANGLCDNLVSCVARAWDPAKPLYYAPAMNTYMLEHPLTFKHKELLTNLLNYKEIPAVAKELMCGDKGAGAMAPVALIASMVAGEIRNKFALVSG